MGFPPSKALRGSWHTTTSGALHLFRGSCKGVCHLLQPHLLNSVSVFRRWWLGPYYDRTPITCVTYGQHWSTIEVFQSESSFTMHRKALQYDATSIPVRNGSPNLWSWDDRYSLCIYIYIFFNVVACKRIALKAIPRSKEILQKWPPEPGQQ